MKDSELQGELQGGSHYTSTIALYCPQFHGRLIDQSWKAALRTPVVDTGEGASVALFTSTGGILQRRHFMVTPKIAWPELLTSVSAGPQGTWHPWLKDVLFFIIIGLPSGSSVRVLIPDQSPRCASIGWPKQQGCISSLHTSPECGGPKSLQWGILGCKL